MVKISAEKFQFTLIKTSLRHLNSNTALLHLKTLAKYFTAPKAPNKLVGEVQLELGISWHLGLHSTVKPTLTLSPLPTLFGLYEAL